MRCQSVRPPVCLSVCLSRSYILSRRVIISSFFHHFSFSVPHVMAIFRREPPPPNGNIECRWSRHKSRSSAIYMAIDPMTCWTCEQQVRQFTVQFTAHTVTHQWSYIYNSLQHAQPRRREKNRIYLYAAVNLKRNLPSVYCIIEATDRHEASRGLSATAELLFMSPQTMLSISLDRGHYSMFPPCLSHCPAVRANIGSQSPAGPRQPRYP